jgi:hypothetical protein
MLEVSCETIQERKSIETQLYRISKKYSLKWKWKTHDNIIEIWKENKN